MKRKDYTDLKEKTIKELVKLASAKKAEATKKKMEILGGKEKNLKLHRNLRAEVAKILTLIREKEILEKLAPKEEAKVEDKKVVKESKKTK
jgi:ribosomal protein L29